MRARASRTVDFEFFCPVGLEGTAGAALIRTGTPPLICIPALSASRAADLGLDRVTDGSQLDSDLQCPRLTSADYGLVLST